MAETKRAWVQEALFDLKQDDWAETLVKECERLWGPDNVKVTIGGSPPVENPKAHTKPKTRKVNLTDLAFGQDEIKSNEYIVG